MSNGVQAIYGSSCKTLRGGRMTKWKGRVASCSPMLGRFLATVSPAAISLAVALPAVTITTSAEAACTVGPDTFYCSGNNGSVTLSGSPLTVTTSTDFWVYDPFGGTGVDLNGYGGLSFTQSGDGIIESGDNGITAVNAPGALGGGALEVTTVGDVSGFNGDGIQATGLAGTNGLSVTTNGTVLGQNGSGIEALNQGNGALTVTSTADVSGTREFGIWAFHQGSGALAITANGNTTGNTIGVVGVHAGDGDLSIATTGTVTGENNEGIFAKHYGVGTLEITASGDVSGGRYGDGIDARHYNSGALSVTANGDVTGYYSGVNARHVGSGDMSITTTGNVSGTNVDGIRVENLGSGATEITTSGPVSGGDDGIEARHTGSGYGIDYYGGMARATQAASYSTASGSLTITATGDVTGADNGIEAYTGPAATDMTISAANVTGGDTGIYAIHHGSGALSVTTTGQVSGTADDGIHVENSGSGATVIATSGPVSGGDDGIEARHTGSGYGIYYYGGMAQATGAASYSTASGSLTITATGDVTGADIGIDAYTGPAATDMTISAASVTGGTTGIYANHNGSGELSITMTGTVNGVRDDGIIAQTGDNSTGLTISTASVTGETGIIARHYGSGAISITTTGDVTGTSHNGIDVYGDASTSDLTISATSVTGESDGIEVDHFGSGAISITTTGDVVGLDEDGINVDNGSSGTDLTISAASVTGGEDGIQVNHRGSGAATITTTGEVVGDGDGIDVNSYGSGVVTVTTTGTVSGGDQGIEVRHEESDQQEVATQGDALAETDISVDNAVEGAVTITATDHVSGGGVGILAQIAGGSTDVDITASSVSGGSVGIEAMHGGEGDISIATSGAIEGGAAGILALGGQYTGDMTVTTGDVTGRVYVGILTSHSGTGDLAVSVSGAVTGGIAAITNGYAQYDNIGYNAQGGSFTVTSTGSLNGLYAFVDLAENEPNSELNVLGSVDGKVAMGFGSDTLRITGDGDDGSTVAAGTVLDGYGLENWEGFLPEVVEGVTEDDSSPEMEETTEPTFDESTASDMLVFDGWTGQLDASILNFEQISLVNGTNMVFDPATSDTFTTPDGVDGLLFAIETGSTAQFLDSMTIEGDVLNQGTIDLSTANGTVGTRLTVSGDYEAASDLVIDADLSSGGGTDNSLEGDAAYTDQIVIAGNASGTTAVTVNNTGSGLASTDINANETTENNEGLLFAQVQGGTAASDSFTLAGGAVVEGPFQLDVVAFDPSSSSSGNWDYVLAITGYSTSATAYESLHVAGLTLAEPGTLRDRYHRRQFLLGGNDVPSQSTNRPWQFGADPADGKTGVWMLLDGSWEEFRPANSSTNTKYDVDSWKLQFGVDTLLASHESGDLFGGIALHKGGVSLDAKSDAGSASNNTDSYGVSVMLTWLGLNGFYVDGQAILHRFESDLSAAGFGTVASGVKGSGHTFSLEFGKRFEDVRGWDLIPQVQFSHTDVDFESFDGPSGEKVDPGDASSFATRIGLAAEREWQLSNTREASFYGLANVVHESFTESGVDVDGFDLLSDVPEWTGEIGLGGSLTWDDGMGTVFAEVTATEALSDGTASGLSGQVGFAFRF
ncbi:autotransporter outer membrane beta-barrel domain-containing protein [Aliiruegeria sabulilitoris]|uniref:autotransporter outer membrane beta-barrel domain-containing protein n=1 Tax=Aliiruegeria sabulilitoris TaxID=1510458 RepID=UPI0018D24F20|nr:autotransporter outer membrane beta-barrel domain-containing protein [Aliiruegeria sabulilitoris]